MKKLYILSVLTSLLASSLAQAATCNMKPTFESNYIKMKGKRSGNRCGEFNIAPTKGSVSLNAQLMESKREGLKKILAPGKITAKQVSIESAGIRAAYDNGSQKCKTHWRIYCYQTKKGKSQQVNCKDYVKIDQVKHPRACFYAKKDYAPLNMYKDAPAQ